jgi:hypothetical protein
MKHQELNQSDPKVKNPDKKEQGYDPSVPGSDPDQTPVREVENPPVAEPERNDKQPKKVGF